MCPYYLLRIGGSLIAEGAQAYKCFSGDLLSISFETERSPVAPGAGLISERPREGRCEKRAFLAGILPDRCFDVATSHRVSGFFVVGSHLFPPLFEMKLALSREEESQCTFQGGTEATPLPAGRRD